MDDRQPAHGVADETARLDLPAGTVVVTMPDELDYTNAAEIGQQLAAAFDGDVTTVIADFTPTAFCDSSGIAALARAYKQAEAADATFRVVAPNRFLTDYLAIIGLAAFLLIHPSLPDALRAAAGPAGGVRQRRT